MDMNAREAMHVIELRTAPQGHPSYRRICQAMHRAIAGQPAGTVDGRLRTTEQGEMVAAKYLIRGIARRELELACGAVVETSLHPPSGGCRPLPRGLFGRGRNSDLTKTVSDTDS